MNQQKTNKRKGLDQITWKLVLAVGSDQLDLFVFPFRDLNDHVARNKVWLSSGSID